MHIYRSQRSAVLNSIKNELHLSPEKIENGVIKTPHTKPWQYCAVFNCELEFRASKIGREIAQGMGGICLFSRGGSSCNFGWWLRVFCDYVCTAEFYMSLLCFLLRINVLCKVRANISRHYARSLELYLDFGRRQTLMKHDHLLSRHSVQSSKKPSIFAYPDNGSNELYFKIL